MILDQGLDMTLEARSTKEGINELEFINVKNFCSLKDIIQTMKRHIKTWGKDLQILSLIKTLYLDYVQNS